MSCCSFFLADTSAVLSTMAAALFGAVAGKRLRLPGGAVVGSMLLAAATNLAVGGVVVHDSIRMSIVIAVGVSVGLLIQRGMLRSMKSIVLPATVASVLLVGSGLLIAELLKLLQMAPRGVGLATAPGGLSVLAATAVEQDLDAPEVVVFHVVRLVLVLLSLPLLAWLVQRSAGPAASSGGVDTKRLSDLDVDSRPTSWASRLVFVLSVAVGAVVALALASAGMPGALVLGGAIGSAAVSLLSGYSLVPAPALRLGLEAGVGWLTATLVSPETVGSLGSVVFPALLSAALLIVIGMVIAFIFRWIGPVISGDLLATSPGGMEAITMVALDRDVDPSNAIVFHTIRLFLVLACLPLLLALG